MKTVCDGRRGSLAVLQSMLAGEIAKIGPWR